MLMLIRKSKLYDLGIRPMSDDLPIIKLRISVRMQGQNQVYCIQIIPEYDIPYALLKDANIITNFYESTKRNHIWIAEAKYYDAGLSEEFHRLEQMGFDINQDLMAAFIARLI